MIEIICLSLIQAAIGSVSLDMARQKGLTGQIEEEFGIQVIFFLVTEIIASCQRTLCTFTNKYNGILALS